MRHLTTAVTTHAAILLIALTFGVTAQAQLNIAITATSDSVRNGTTLVQVAQSVNANGGGTITLTAGTYFLTQSVVMGSNMTINGAGPGTLIQLPSSPNGIAAFTSYGGVNMTISNLVMDGGIPLGAFLLCCGGSGNPYESTGVNMYSTNTAEVNVYLTNLEIRNFKLGLFMGTVNGVYITNVNVHDNNPGEFAHNAYLVACDNVNISHSSFNNAHTGDGLHIDFGGAYTTITKSEFSGNNGYGILSQQNVVVTMADTRIDFNQNDGIQIDAAGLSLLRNSGSLNRGYGFNVPDTLDANGTLVGYWGYYDNPDIGYFYQVPTIADITGNMGYPSTPNLYEAEQADGVVGPIDTADWTTAYPGFSGVGAVDFNAKHLTNGLLTFSNVGAYTAGNYSLSIRYYNPTSASQSMALTVNGVAQPALTFPVPPSGSTWQTLNFTAALNAGNNVVQLGVKGSAAPEIDYLQVNTVKPPAPAAPTGLTATALTPYSVRLNWQTVPGASWYVVFQNGAPIATHVVGTSYTDSKILFGNSSITYNVQAQNEGGGSAQSAAAAIQTPIDSPAGFQGPNTGSGAGNSFNWMSANGAAHYNLKRATVSGGPYTTVAQIANTTSLFSSNFEQSGQDTTAVPGTTYYYVVTAVDGNGNESATHTYELAAATPSPTFTLATSPSSLTLAWNQSAGTTVAVQPANAFSGAVALTVTGLPQGVTASVGQVSGTTIPLTLTASSSATPGTFAVTLTGMASGVGNPKASAVITLTVASQVITFNAIPPQVLGTSLSVSATASSGLPVSFTVVPNGNCTISGSVVTFTNTGNCGVVANQSGNGVYGAAPSVGQIIQVNTTPSPQAITFPTIAAQAVGVPLTLAATASSALPVSFASSTASVCSVAGTVANFLSAGTCTITASQAGNGSYKAATAVAQSFTVNGSLPVLSAAGAVGITSTSVTITWTTDQATTSLVNYGLTSAYGSTSGTSTALVTAHLVTLTGLTPGTIYNFNVTSANGAGASTSSPNYTFATAASNPVAAPSVGYISYWGITNTSAVISWSTNIPADTSLAYGTTPALGQTTPGQAALTSNHGVTLTGLTSGTTYYFVAQSTANGVTGYSTTYSFTTAGIPGTANPVITNVVATNLTATSATITWTTDQASSSLVNYGTGTAYGTSSPADTAFTLSHSVVLNGLNPGTTYYFDVVSTNAGGISATSANSTFNTLAQSAAPPNVGYVSAWGINSSSATVTWSTDIPATTQLAYGTTSTLGQLSPLKTTLDANHGVTLTGLNSGTTYYFVAQSTGANGVTGYSTVYQFTTPDGPTAPGATAPNVGYVLFWGVTSSGATISWSTDVPATTQLVYGTTSALGQTTPLQTTLASSHGVVLTGLKPNTTYYFEAQSAGANGSTGISSIYSFTTGQP